jgi:hypothetical protein
VGDWKDPNGSHCAKSVHTLGSPGLEEDSDIHEFPSLQILFDPSQFSHEVLTIPQFSCAEAKAQKTHFPRRETDVREELYT